MDGVLAAARSGLSLAQMMLATTAENVANLATVRPADTEPFRAASVLTAASGDGGVQAVVRRAQGAPRQAFAPNHPHADSRGMVTLPVVDVAGEVVGLHLASYLNRANLAVLRRARAAYQEVLDLAKR